MNETIEMLMRRKSIRAYTDQPVTDEEKWAILQAALRAPTAGNMMLYSIIEVEDQRLKDRLAETCDHQPFIARSPYLLLFLADYQRWYDTFLASGAAPACEKLGVALRHPQEGDLLLACCDALIAAETAVIAAESLGIGSCYIGDVLEQYETHRDLFGLPPYVLPVTLVCFGHPTTGQAARRQPERFPREYIVHRNRYHRLDETALAEMMRPLEDRFTPSGDTSSATNAGQALYFRKFAADFSLEMNRSVRAMLASWTAGERK